MTPEELASTKRDIGNLYPSGGIVHRCVQEIDRMQGIQAELLKDLRFFHMIAKARNSDAAWRDVEMVAANAIEKAEGRR